MKTGHPCAGVRTRPSDGGVPGQDGLVGKGPKITQKMVFSEGRGLRARVAWPYANRGISLLGGGWANGRGHNGDDVLVERNPVCGRAEPAPARMGRQGIGRLAS